MEGRARAKALRQRRALGVGRTGELIMLLNRGESGAKGGAWGRGGLG